MSGDKVIQTRCTPALLARIDRYKNNEELSTDSAAIRKLVTFALDIIDSSADAPAVSNRDIFENILEEMKINSSILSQTHGYTYRNNLTDEGRAESKGARVVAREHGKKQTEIFLSGEK